MASSIRLAGGALRELRIHLCQTTAASNGVREFIQKDYVDLKHNNRDFPILVRECSGITPRIWARYEHGVETSVSVENAPRQKIMELIKQMATKKMETKKID
ncbi:hypothetical protein niasHS_000799 [Heterodera schachtii]|uniref:NADH dehydrogenase [ubiquinone] 1 alpha subcomplex subunit 2 n=1 Tax=Heterodera schachtii TaxID=97005 RepID=A0ABD2K8I6_HETSC